MKEQLLNLLYILPVMLPLFLAGVMVRFSRRSRPDGWRITVIGAAVSVLGCRTASESGQRTAGGYCLRSYGLSRRCGGVRTWPALPPGLPLTVLPGPKRNTIQKSPRTQRSGGIFYAWGALQK